MLRLATNDLKYRGRSISLCNHSLVVPPVSRLLSYEDPHPLPKHPQMHMAARRHPSTLLAQISPFTRQPP